MRIPIPTLAALVRRGSRVRLRGALALAVALPLWAPLAAQQPAAAPPARGFEPGPAGTWTTAGGSPSGTRAVDGALQVAGLRVQQLLEPGGELLSEPLVWQDRAVTEHQHGRDRVLTVWDLATGLPQGSPLRLRGAGSLRPSLWGNRLVLRVGEDRLEEHVLSDQGARRRSARTAQRGFGRPLLRGQELLFEADGRLQLARFGQSEPDWSVELELQSEPCWTATCIYALERAGGAGRPIALDPTTGERLAEDDPRLPVPLAGLGWLPPLELTPDQRVGLAVGPGALWVDLTRVAERRGLQPYLGLSGSTGMDPETFAVRTHPLLGADVCAPILLERSWLMSLRLSPEDSARTGLPRAGFGECTAAAAGFGYLGFAEAGDGTGIAEARGPWALCGGQVVGPDVALDPASGAILWRLDGPPAAGAVPTSGGLLRWFPGGRIELWSARGPAEPLARLPLAPGRIELALDAAGRRIDGALEVESLDAGEWRLVRRGAGGERAFSASELGYLSDASGTPVFAADSQRFRAGLDAAVRDQQRAAVAGLCEAARGSRDAALMEEVLQAGLELGASESVVRRLEDALAQELQRARAPAAQRVEEVRAGLLELRAVPVARLARALGELPPAWRGALELPLLERLLGAQRSHPVGLQLLEQRLPEGLASGPGGLAEQPLDWVRFLRATRRVPLERVRLPVDTGGEPDADQRRLAAAVEAAGGAPLVGLRSRDLLVITSIERPAALAELLALGELVAETLERVFEPFAAAGGPARELQPLEIRVFGSRAEYLAQNASRPGAHGEALAWTAGNYSPQEGLSRLYLPDGAFEAGLEAATDTFVHELVHHWLDLRCLALEPRAGLRVTPEDPGFWIVEGFAAMFEGFDWDLERGSFTAGSPRAAGLDLVAMAEASQLLPWEQVLGWSQRDVERGAGRDPRPIGMRWSLRSVRQSTATGRFYAQAEALSAMLFAEPDSRRVLLETLLGFYRGEPAGRDIAAALGRGAQALGDAARAYARAAVLGD